MDEITRRKAFQRVKTMTNAQFWNWMNWLHTKAYAKALEHVKTAMECHPRMYPKLINEVIDKATEIREQWDGMPEISISETEHADYEEVIKGRKGGLS